MKDIQLVILMAGKSTRLQPLNYNMPKGLNSFMQIPAIYTMIIDYINRGLDDITIIASPQNKDIIEGFLNKAFSNIKTKVVVQDNPKGPLDAFRRVKKVKKSTLLLLGDTTCETTNDFDHSFIAYSQVPDYSRWCLLDTDEEDNVVSFVDKPDVRPNTDKAIIGLYYFKDHNLLNELLNKDYPTIKGEYQLSSLLEEYNKYDTFKAKKFKKWKDSGTLEDIVNIKRKSLTGRIFNNFKISKNAVITKESDYDILKREAHWYEKVHDTPLSVYIPQFYGYNVKDSIINYRLEYLPYKTLAEYFVFYPIVDDNWKYMFKELIRVLEDFWAFNGFWCDINIVDCTRKMYVDKTLQRIANWDRQDILAYEDVVVNGKKLMGFNKILNLLMPHIEEIINNSEEHVGVIHGDPSFQNILFAPEMCIYKLIDPRGAFPNETVFGDVRYELAKLRHCYHGMYDYVIYKMFSLEQNDNVFNYKYVTDNVVDFTIFDNVLKRKGFDINEVELIEGLLFISMISLHHDEPEMQKMFYLIGLECLNNVYEKLK